MTPGKVVSVIPLILEQKVTCNIITLMLNQDVCVCFEYSQGWGRLLWKVIDYDYNYMAFKK